MSWENLRVEDRSIGEGANFPLVTLGGVTLSHRTVCPVFESVGQLCIYFYFAISLLLYFATFALLLLLLLLLPLYIYFAYLFCLVI